MRFGNRRFSNVVLLGCKRTPFERGGSKPYPQPLPSREGSGMICEIMKQNIGLTVGGYGVLAIA